jgi:nicotinamide-nucleotide amidase
MTSSANWRRPSAVRARLGNFILGEDDQKLETVLLEELSREQATLATVETFTGGSMAARLSHLAGAEKVFVRGIVTRDLAQLCAMMGLDAKQAGFTLDFAQATARAAREHSGASHALAVLIALDEGADRIEFGGNIFIAIATRKEVVTRHSRMLGGREWVRLGAVEMSLDCLRRHLQGLPVEERIDFEKE